MKNNNSDLVIDMELGIKLAGNKQDLAEELLALLVKKLPDELQAIQKYSHSHDYDELQKILHKLHGAVCYCGVPRLKKAIIHFESVAKHKKTKELPAILIEVESEIHSILKKAGEIL